MTQPRSQLLRFFIWFWPILVVFVASSAFAYDFQQWSSVGYDEAIKAVLRYDVGRDLTETKRARQPSSEHIHFVNSVKFLAAEETTALDWSIVSKTGETRAEHVIAQHGAIDLQKPIQGVFYGDPAATINDAWAIAQRQGIQPVTVNGADIYLIPRANSGYAGGFSGQLQNLDNVTIITQQGTPRIITGFRGIAYSCG